MKNVAILGLTMALLSGTVMSQEGPEQTLQELKQELQALKDQQRALQKKLAELERGADAGTDAAPRRFRFSTGRTPRWRDATTDGAVSTKSEGVTIKQTDEGLSIEIKKKGENGEDEVQNYSAKDWDELAEKHPDVAKRYRPGAGRRFMIGPKALDLKGLPEGVEGILEDLKEQLGDDLGEMDLDQLKKLGQGDLGGMFEHLGKDFPMPNMEKLGGQFRFAFPDGLGMNISGQGMKFESTPDGVRVEITKKGEDGKDKVETYEAESMEALREKHPEIADKFGFSFGPGMLRFGDKGGIFFGKPGEMPEMPDLFKELRGRFGRDPFTPGAPGFSAPFRNRGIATPSKLGVMVDVSPDGVTIKEVQENSLAAELGMQAGDLIISINGEPIRDVESVKNALQKSAGTKAVIQRNGEEKTLEKAAPMPRKGSMKV